MCLMVQIRNPTTPTLQEHDRQRRCASAQCEAHQWNKSEWDQSRHDIDTVRYFSVPSEPSAASASALQGLLLLSLRCGPASSGAKWPCHSTNPQATSGIRLAVSPHNSPGQGLRDTDPS